MTFLHDRALQLEILEMLATKYPDVAEVQTLCTQRPGAIQAIAYLAEHRLVEATPTKAMSQPTTFIVAKITAAGLDFLADDGGITAILGVVTIKLHHETLLALLEQKIRESDAPEAERSRLSSALRALAPKAMETLAKELVTRGLNSVPSAAQWLQTQLDLLPT